MAFCSMIIDLNLHGKFAIVVGGGNEALKRIQSLAKHNCKILVISENVGNQIKLLARNEKIQLKRQKITDVKFLSEYKPDMVITTTNDSKLNEKIIRKAKKEKILAYSSDNPEESDFANPAIIDFEDIVKVAIFTGGKSPAMSKKLRTELEKILEKIITKEEIAKIKIQDIARKSAKKKIKSQSQRKTFLNGIMNDNRIKQLIKDGMVEKAEKAALAKLESWNDK